MEEQKTLGLYDLDRPFRNFVPAEKPPESQKEKQGKETKPVDFDRDLPLDRFVFEY